jgi:hypothetical protein
MAISHLLAVIPLVQEAFASLGLLQWPPVCILVSLRCFYITAVRTIPGKVLFISKPSVSHPTVH